jgi:membrane-bound lytic murein transglycosylase D
MQLTKRILFRLSGFTTFLITAISFIISQPAFSQPAVTDTTCKIVLASLLNKKKQQSFARESNIVFPAILKGNEEESMEYIENFSSRRKAYLERMYKKGKIFLPKAVTIFKKYNLPQELKILVALESAYNPNAVSKAGAVGYWQIMDEVAKEYGMNYTKYETAAAKRHSSKHRTTKKVKAKAKQKDDRMNFMKSTITAARYLHARRLNLDDNWLLVVASYNCGVGNVWSAMERSGKTNPSFWDIKKYLPAETRAYVMNFITLNVIFSNYENFKKNKLIFKPVKMELTDSPDKNLSDASVTSDLK